MKWYEFVVKVYSVCRESEFGNPLFSFDKEKNIYIANCGDVCITGNSVSHEMTIKLNNGHMARLDARYIVV